MKELNSIDDLVNEYKQFKQDLANDGHPNASFEFFLEMILDCRDLFRINITV